MVIDEYGSFYPELQRNAATILDNLTREEKQFQKTVRAGLEHLDELLADLKTKNETVLDGGVAFDLYATLGLPLEITKDIAQEQGLDVDTKGFQEAMEAHRLASGAGKEFGEMGGADVEAYTNLLASLIQAGKLTDTGVAYDPYHEFVGPVELLGLIRDGQPVTSAEVGDEVDVLLPKTGFTLNPAVRFPTPVGSSTPTAKTGPSRSPACANPRRV